MPDTPTPLELLLRYGRHMRHCAREQLGGLLLPETRARREAEGCTCGWERDREGLY